MVVLMDVLGQLSACTLDCCLDGFVCDGVWHTVTYKAVPQFVSHVKIHITACASQPV